MAGRGVASDNRRRHCHCQLKCRRLVHLSAHRSVRPTGKLVFELDGQIHASNILASDNNVTFLPTSSFVNLLCTSLLSQNQPSQVQSTSGHLNNEDEDLTRREFNNLCEGKTLIGFGQLQLQLELEREQQWRQHCTLGRRRRRCLPHLTPREAGATLTN